MRLSSSAGRPAGSGRVSVPVRLDLRREALHDVLREQREERAGQVRRRQRQQRVRERPRHARMQQLAEAAAGRPEQLRAPAGVSPTPILLPQGRGACSPAARRRGCRLPAPARALWATRRRAPAQTSMHVQQRARRHCHFLKQVASSGQLQLQQLAPAERQRALTHVNEAR